MVSVAETLVGRAHQQPRFAESDVRHSRRITRNTLTCWRQAFFVLAWFVGRSTLKWIWG
jgi:hypothetical protein